MYALTISILLRPGSKHRVRKYDGVGLAPGHLLPQRRRRVQEVRSTSKAVLTAPK